MITCITHAYLKSTKKAKEKEKKKNEKKQKGDEAEEDKEKNKKHTHGVAMLQSGTSNVRGTSGTFPGRDL